MKLRRPVRSRHRSAGTRRTVLIANPGADLYGSDRMVLETIRALVEADHRVVLTVPGPGPLVDRARSAGAEVISMPTAIIRKSALKPAGLIRLAVDAVRSVPPGLGLLRAVRPDLVLVNTITAPLWFALARVRGIPSVCHVHEGESSAARPVRIALAAPLLLADTVIANSEFSLGVLAGAIPALRRRAVVIYNAVAGPASTGPARERLDGPVRLLYVGRLSARKGPDVAVAAVALLRERGVPAHLTLVGAVFPGYEWFEADLRRSIDDADIDDAVTFAGFADDRWPATAASDIVLVPSTSDEGFGNVAVEAGLAARPLVVSDLTGLREASAGVSSAVRVPSSDPGAIADAVTAVTADWPAYRDAAVADAEALADRYSHRRYAEQINAVVLDQLSPTTSR